MKKTENIFILGDSYSTFEGYVPEGYPCWYMPNYPESEKEDPDVTKVEQTWWHALVSERNANLVFNSSYSGSTICNTGYGGADFTKCSFITRTDEFINDGFFEKNTVDTILIFGATNDTWAGAPIGETKYEGQTTEELYSFLPALSYLLSRLKANAKGARIVFIINDCLSDAVVSGIHDSCKHFDVEYLSLHGISKLDGHPTSLGMTQIKDQVAEYLDKV